MGDKETTQAHLQLYIVKHIQIIRRHQQAVPPDNSKGYIELFTQIFKLKMQQYLEHERMRNNTASTATPISSVEYDFLWFNWTSAIEEAMVLLEAPKKADKSQEDFVQWCAAVSRQRYPMEMDNKDESIVKMLTQDVVRGVRSEMEAEYHLRQSEGVSDSG